MAPSPELGQPKPKVPDKMDIKSCSNDGTNNELDTQKSTNAIQQDSENLGSWDDTELRKLLDEAITYKRPKDREHKSEIFRELLQNAEQEDKARINCISSRILGRSVRGSNRHTQGGSLQDLVETFKQDQLLESDCLIGSHLRRQHNSRQKKYSSVSTRQREGGSLPSNVNCNPYEDQFSNDFGKRGIKNERFILISGSGSSRQDSFNRGNEDSQLDGKVSHTVIEIGDVDVDETCHLLAHDSLAQDPHSSDEGTELNPMKKLPRLAYPSHQYLNLESMSEMSRIDKTVQFNSLKSGTKSTDIQFNNACVAVNSVIGPGHNAKFPTYHHPQSIHLADPKSTDENGNAVQTFNSTLKSSSQLTKSKDGKKKKTERNVIKCTMAKDIEGNRGNDNLEDLVSYVENTGKNGVISNNVTKGSLAQKNKKNSAENKRENSGNNKLKKYNSMENLKSTSKLDEENAQSERDGAVVLRQKQQVKKSTEVKENNKKQQQHPKRSERRSWGTEELTYLGETNSIKETNGRGEGESIKETRKKDSRENKETKDTKDIKDNKENKDNKDGKDSQKINKKKDEQCDSLLSTESMTAQNESGFYTVTKKRKSKKKQEEIQQKTNYQQPHAYGKRRYQSGQNYSSDRDAYLAPFNANDKRRKSTSSSMPPSEKSDYSDSDSVHSLPIESTTRSSNNIHPTLTSTGNNTPAASYAEIAKIPQDKQTVLAASLDKWPVVSNNGKTPESLDNSNASTCSTMSVRSQNSGRANNENVNDVALKASPNGNSLIDHQKAIEMPSPTDMTRSSNGHNVTKLDVVKTTSDTNPKSPLQKSKSVDNDNYVNMNIDQYPALEKTVKPQKQYQSMPAVQGNNTVVNLNNVNISPSNKSTNKPTKLSSQSQPINTSKSIDSTTNAMNQGKKSKSNLSSQSPPKDKNHFNLVPDTQSINQIDQMKLVKNKIFSQQIPSSVDTMNDGNYGVVVPPVVSHTTNITKKISKKDKTNHQNSHTQNHLNYDRSRPAVIILDNNNKYGDNVSPLLFGDFNEDELRQWDQDSDPSFIMPTNNHYDQSSSTSTLSANDINTIHSISSVDQLSDVASNQMQTNVISSSFSNNCVEEDQSNNNSELDNNCNENAITVNHNIDDVVLKPVNVNTTKGGQSFNRNFVTVECNKKLTIRYVEPINADLSNFNHNDVVHYLHTTWEDVMSKGNAQFYNGQ